MEILKSIAAGFLFLNISLQAGETTTILALGNSITAREDSYRSVLVPAVAGGWLNVEFIGPNEDPISRHAGYGGKNTGYLLTIIREVYSRYPADIVLMHSGHNSFSDDKPVKGIIRDTLAIIDTMREINPSVTVLLAQVIPAGKLPKYAYIPELNTELSSLARHLKNLEYNVILVNQADGFDRENDTLPDKVHPNESGAGKMAAKWMESLVPLLGTRCEARVALHAPDSGMVRALPLCPEDVISEVYNLEVDGNEVPVNEAKRTLGTIPIELKTPPMTTQKPAPGRRVRQVAPEYKGTDVYHALYLPVDWVPGSKYPVIVEYTGNKWAPGGSTGEVKDANLGYGMSGGRGFIWVSMPYVEIGHKTNAVTWWGDKQATVDYCKVNLPRICKQFGGDPGNVFICGFSRGAIAVSYIGLADDEIAALWKGMFTHDHFDGQKKWDFPGSDRASALVRLARLKGRPVLICGMNATKVRDDYLKDYLDLARFTFLDVPTSQIFDIPVGNVIHPHTDLWMHKESEYRKQARGWLADVLREKGK